MATKAHLEGNKRYLETLDEIKVRVSKGSKQKISDIAKQQNDSVNGYIKKAIKEKVERDTGDEIDL